MKIKVRITTTIKEHTVKTKRLKLKKVEILLPYEYFLNVIDNDTKKKKSAKWLQKKKVHKFV